MVLYFLLFNFLSCCSNKGGNFASWYPYALKVRQMYFCHTVVSETKDKECFLESTCFEMRLVQMNYFMAVLRQKCFLSLKVCPTTRINSLVNSLTFRSKHRQVTVSSFIVLKSFKILRLISTCFMAIEIPRLPRKERKLPYLVVD